MVTKRQYNLSFSLSPSFSLWLIIQSQYILVMIWPLAQRVYVTRQGVLLQFLTEGAVNVTGEVERREEKYR